MTFEQARPFHNGFAAVKNHEKWRFINHLGHFIDSPEFDYISDFSEGIAHFYKNRKLGLVRTNGSTLMLQNVGRVHEFSDSLAVACRDKPIFCAIEKDTGRRVMREATAEDMKLFPDWTENSWTGF